MGWELSIHVTYQPEDGSVMAFPGSADEPYYAFADDDLDEVVELIKEIGRRTNLDGLDEYADVVKSEGEAVRKALSRRWNRDSLAIRKALNRVRDKHRRQAGGNPTPAAE